MTIDETDDSETVLEGENPLNLEQAGLDEICLIPNFYNADFGYCSWRRQETTIFFW